MTRDKPITRATQATFLLAATISFVIPLPWRRLGVQTHSAPFGSMVWSLFAEISAAQLWLEAFKVLLVGSLVEDLFLS